MCSHIAEKNIQAVSFTYARTEWKVLDKSIQADIDFLKKFQDGEFLVTERTLSMTRSGRLRTSSTTAR